MSSIKSETADHSISLLDSAWPAKGTLKYVLTFDMVSPSNNVIKDMHFQVYKKLRQSWHDATLAQLGGMVPAKPLDVSFLVIERTCAGSLDWDNAYGGLKPILDCLVAPSDRNPSGLGIIADDSPKHMPLPPFLKQLKGTRNAGSTRIFVYELEQELTKSN